MIRFTKMHGIGNDFVMVNGFESMPAERDLRGLAQAICDRRFGVGSDGLIFVLPGETQKFRMRMLNPDGSESEMCGNGIRCLAEFLIDEGLTTEASIPVETGAGVLVLDRVAPGMVRVDMGMAKLNPQEIGMPDVAREDWIDQPLSAQGEEFRTTVVSMGNPHIVIFVDDVASIDLERIGPAFETHELFPDRVNVHFVQVTSRTAMIQRTWERGAGATLACGTGACAAGVAAVLNQLTDRVVQISLPGGDLTIDYRDDGHVFMTGPAATSFRGEWP